MAGVPPSNNGVAENGGAAAAAAAPPTVPPAPTAVVAAPKKVYDILENPYGEIFNLIMTNSKEIRVRMDTVTDAQRRAKTTGPKLTAAELVEYSKLADFQYGLVRNQGMIETLKRNRNEYAIRIAELRAGILGNNGQGTLEKLIHCVQTIRRILHAREIVGHAVSPIVRKSFEEGAFGAPKFTEEQFAILDGLYTLLHVSSEGCTDHDEFKKKLNDAAEQLQMILEDREEGEEDPRRKVLNMIITSEYFEGLQHNIASMKEMEDKKKEEKSEEERKMKAEDPPVTFLNCSLPPPSSQPPAFFGYDDSLPHPNQLFFNGAQQMLPPPGMMPMQPMPLQMQQQQQPPFVMAPPPHLAHMPNMMHPMPPMMQPMGPPPMGPMPPLPPMGQAQPLMQQQLQPVNTFMPNGSHGQGPAWEPPAVPVAGPVVRTSPTGSKEGSGSVTPTGGASMRGGRGAGRGHFEPRRPIANNFNQQFAPPMNNFNPPPFGIMFPNNGMPFQNNGYRTLSNQRYPLTSLTSSMAGLGLNSHTLPLGMPPGNGVFIPPTTSVSSNGQPFRPNYRGRGGPNGRGSRGAPHQNGPARN